MEVITNPFEDISKILLSEDISENDKLASLEALKNVDSITLESYISYVKHLIGKLAESCLKREEDCLIFQNFLSIISDISLTSEIAPKVLAETIYNQLNKFEDLNGEFILGILGALEKLVRVIPEIIFTLKGKFEEILNKFKDERVYDGIFDVVEVACWSLPPAFTEYRNVLKEIPDTPFKDKLKDRYYQFIAKVGKRNYYIVKDEIRKVIEQLYTTTDYPKLLLLSNVTFPSEDLSLAKEVFDVLELRLESLEDSNIKKLAILTLANVSKNADFAELQTRFTRVLTEILATELEEEIKKVSLETVSMVHWNPRVNLDDLIEAIGDLAMNTSEADSVRMAAVASLFRLSILPQVKKEEIIGILTQILASAANSDLKSETIDALTTLAKWVRGEIDRVIDALLDISSRLDEEDFIRIKAIDNITELVRVYPEKLLRYIDNIVELWNISTEWGIRDSIVKLVGEVLLRIDEKIDDFLNILLQALEDPYIYREAIVFLLRISARHPDFLAGRIKDILRAYETIKGVEMELKEEGTDLLGGDYFYLVETSRRYLARLLTNLGVKEETVFDEVVDNLLKQFEGERNDIVEREIAHNLSKLFEKNPERFRTILAKHLLEERKLTILSAFGVTL